MTGPLPRWGFLLWKRLFLVPIKPGASLWIVITLSDRGGEDDHLIRASHIREDFCSLVTLSIGLSRLASSSKRVLSPDSERTGLCWPVCKSWVGCCFTKSEPLRASTTVGSSAHWMDADHSLVWWMHASHTMAVTCLWECVHACLPCYSLTGGDSYRMAMGMTCKGMPRKNSGLWEKEVINAA